MSYVPPFDPSQMDPKMLMQMSELIRQLPPEQLNRMQTLMHNMMAGFDVRREMEEFEKTLPPGFREKLMGLVASAPASAPVQAPVVESGPAEKMDVHEARMTILRAVSGGRMTPEEAEKLLFAG